MLICIPNVLTQEQIKFCREQLAQAEWVDGKVTTGAQSATVKANQQVEQNSPIAKQLGEMITRTLSNLPRFIAAALPSKIFPPLFNCYRDGGYFGIHTDNSIMTAPHSYLRLRTDLSATLFLCEPDTYSGGELTIETTYGAQEVKLNAGDMVLYPSTSLHQVKPVTQGERLCAFFWLQSMVRDEGERSLLYDLDQSIQTLAAVHGIGHAEVLRLSGIYHNLIRRWADI